MFSPLASASTQDSSGPFSPSFRIGILLALALCAFASLASIAVSSAGAVTDAEELGQFGSGGTGAGQFIYSYKSSSDPITGHLYVTDSASHRIDVFTAWGEFLKAFGWGVADGKSEPETCTTTCVAGLGGSGSGQFGAKSSGPDNVVVDASGNVYVLDLENHRLQKFDPSGQFVLMFGKEVDKTTGGDVCTATSGDECQAGTKGSGPGELSEGTGLATSQAGDVLVGGTGRIEEFEPDGAFKSEFEVPGVVDDIAVRPTDSDLYVLLRSQDDVHKLSSAGAELGSLKAHEPRAIATDAQGDLYVAQQSSPQRPPEVIEFDPSGKELSRCCIPRLLPGYSSASIGGLATNSAGDLYVSYREQEGNGETSFIAFYGPPPVKWPPPSVPPAIVAQFPSSVDSTSATLKAQINPNFWPDTRYYLEYGPESCASSPCTRQPAAPGSELGSGAVKRTVTSSGTVLTGLTPGTTYHYRFVAQSSGGGPVRGVGGTEASDGAEGTFTTFAATKAPAPCANDAFRTGPAAKLPDCRAYEMVSPVDKSADIRALADIEGFDTSLDQASVDGEALTYSSYGAFVGAEGGPWTDQYLAHRGAQGWNSEALGGPLVGQFYDTNYLENEFKAFSPDLCDSWVLPQAEPTLDPNAVVGLPNLYRRHNCPKGYEALTVVPPSAVPADYYPELQGFSADGAVSIFRVNGKLTEDAKAGGAFQVYEAQAGALKAVCVFPEGTTPTVEAEFPDCSAGTPTTLGFPSDINRSASVSHALSEDGTRVYWSASRDGTRPGKIYLRLNGQTTLKVSEAPGPGHTTKPARFWDASPDGSKALYEVEDPDQNPTPINRGLYLYDLAAEASTLIAPKVKGVVATSEDLSRIYFVSAEVLAGTSGAIAGENNLYLDDEGADTFIATLSEKDVARPEETTSDVATWPVFHLASATPDGAHLAFISTEPLTGFDNTDAQSGEADSEVFSYDAASAKLACASCSPAGVRPAGRDRRLSVTSHLWSAASLPGPQTELNSPRVISPDGTKLFFTSYTDLLPADTNGVADVYEWEALGSGSCKDEADPNFFPPNGGCLFLISSGESPSDSELIDTAADGRDVFFTTNASLLPQDSGLIDIYDAREGGGLPPPPALPAACEGEACQGPSAPPNDPTPGSSSFEGAGNVNEPKAAKKHKHKAHKKKRKHAKGRAQRAAKSNRREPR